MDDEQQIEAQRKNNGSFYFGDSDNRYCFTVVFYDFSDPEQLAACLSIWCRYAAFRDRFVHDGGGYCNGADRKQGRSKYYEVEKTLGYYSG